MVGDVHAELVGVGLANFVVVEGLGEGDLPVLVHLVLPLEDGVVLLGHLDAVVHGGLVGEHILAASGHGHGHAPGLSLSTLLDVVAGLVDVGEVLVTAVVLLATELGLLVVDVVASPELVVAVGLGNNALNIRDVLGVVLGRDTSMPVLFVVDGSVKADFQVLVLPGLVLPLLFLSGGDLQTCY